MPLPVLGPRGAYRNLGPPTMEPSPSLAEGLTDTLTTCVERPSRVRTPGPGPAPSRSPPHTSPTPPPVTGLLHPPRSPRIVRSSTAEEGDVSAGGGGTPRESHAAPPGFLARSGGRIRVEGPRSAP